MMDSQNEEASSEVSYVPGSSENGGGHFPVVPTYVGTGVPFPSSYPSSLSMSSHNDDTISLQDLLEGGSRVILSIDEKVRDAVLLLGNTGGGKSTVGQIMAGNLVRLHAILTENEEVVIVDDDNRIGAPTTQSKTLIPELLHLKQDGGEDHMAIFDCPGFDDNRGPEQDIASNYFMNQIARRVARVKMLLILNHSSVKLGNDRLDFDLLVGHAITFLKNFPTYSSGIGLVVNKVCSFNPCGVRLGDQAISRGITEFLKGYVKTQKSKSGSPRTTPQAKGDIQRRIEFVEALLEQDQDGHYSKIIFSRTPVEIGPLCDSETVLATREKILGLCRDHLKYCQVDSADFNYSLKETTKRNLESYAKTMNQVVAECISKLVEDFRNFYGRKFLQSKDFPVMNGELQKSTRTIGLLLDKLESLEYSANLLPKLFLDIVQAYFKGWGYWFPLKGENVLEQHGNVFQFFDMAHNTPVWRAIRDWIHPVEELWKELRELQVWYKFCLELERKVGAYEWQMEKPHLDSSGDSPVGVEWMDYIERECNGQLSDEIRELATRLGETHLEAVGDIMRFALAPLEVTVDVEGKRIILTGNYLRLSECISKCDLSGTLKRIEIYAGHTLFIDVDVDGEGKELEVILIAPNWTVIGVERRLNLNGSPGDPHVPAVANEGAFVEGEAGKAGSPGLAGLPGGPGGSFLGIAHSAKNTENLKISSIGGKGGPGQHGGKGANGDKARDATWDDAVFRKRTDYVSHAIYWYRHEGFQGHPGGEGGDGGVSGVGGSGGNIQFFNISPSSNQVGDEVQLIAGNGEAGEEGLGGGGGTGGLPGQGTEAYIERRLYGLFRDVGPRCLPSPSKAEPGSTGDAGTPGQSTEKQREGESSPVITEWECLIDYKYAMLHKGHHETEQFLTHLADHPALQTFMTVEGFTSELGKILKLNSSSGGRNLCKVISPFMKRVEAYAHQNSQRMTGDDKMMVPYVLLTTHTKLMTGSLDRGLAMPGAAPDITEQFKVIRTRMEKWKDCCSSLEIKEILTDENIKMDLNEKILKVMSFLEEVVSPALREADRDLQVRIDTLGAILNELMIRNRPGVLGADERSRLSKVAREKERENEVFREVLSIFGAVLKTTHLVVGAFDYIGKGLDLLSDEGVTNEMIEGEGEGGREPAPIINPGPGENFMRKMSSSEAFQTWGNERELEKDPSPSSTSAIAKLEEFVSREDSMLRAAFDRNDFTHISEVGVEKWPLASLLWETKDLLTILERRSDTKLFLKEVDLLQFSLIYVIDLIHDVVIYERRRSLLEYGAAVNSAHERRVDATEPSLSLRSNISKFGRNIRENLMEMEYRKALNSFEQWVFPFAKIYFDEDNSESLMNSGEEEDGEMYLRKMDQLQGQLEKYISNATTLDDPNAPIAQSKFYSSSSASSTTGPFFVWKWEWWSSEILDILSGNAVRLKADIRQSPDGMDAIKFHRIKINFKLRSENGKLAQEALDKELEKFKVELTHSGVSHYRFRREYYVMTTGKSILFRHTFGEDHDIIQQQQDINDGVLLSPYTLWTIKLVDVSSEWGEMGGLRQRQDYFRKLKEFAPFVDLELGGEGVYVDENIPGRNQQQLDVDKFYKIDHSIVENIHI